MCIRDSSNDGTYGKFVVEPLERGFGTTLGNSLRRVLLSSLPGVAVTCIKIDGVLHEFSTIPGVKEDVTEIVLNIKGLTAKLHCDGPKTVEISAEGPCVVTADSIKCDSEVEILNPEMHIATSVSYTHLLSARPPTPLSCLAPTSRRLASLQRKSARNVRRSRIRARAFVTRASLSAVRKARPVRAPRSKERVNRKW